jgi:cleavage and polyadenylation specificity factor subunit 4
MAMMSMAFPSIETVEYDFEDYALTQGIPETKDPLPYRKSGSVFATGEDAEPVFTSAKHDPRLRTVVCRHWLRDLCMKGNACEFLHQYDLSKMPLCRHGDKCRVKDCPFRHISESERLECVFYSQGFCIHGPFCRYKHVRRDRSDLPVVADFTLGLSQMQAGKDGIQARRPAPKPNEFFKVSLCKHFMQGECPFGDGCHFAHGEDELRKFPKHAAELETAVPASELTDNMFVDEEITTVDYFQGGSSGGGKPSPIVEPEHSAFFMIRAASHVDLAFSTTRREWWFQKRHANEINVAFNDGTPIMLFFIVSESEHVQGAAMVTSPAVRPSKIRSAAEDDFAYRCDVDWVRTTELPLKTALDAAPDLIVPTESTQFCQNMTWRTGESVMKAIWNSPLVTLYEPHTTTTPAAGDDGDAVAASPPSESASPSDDQLLIDFRAPSPNEASWPVSPLPGFIFGCDNYTMDECLGRGIFGLPAHMKAAAAHIQPGSTVLLFNVKERLLFGIFEALTPATMNIDPRAFSKNSRATSSPLPVQIRVQVSLECAPVQESNTVVQSILRRRVGGIIGPLTHPQTVAVASLVASQCGALQFMVEYQNAVRSGQRVQPPPIALPPRKIGRSSNPMPIQTTSTTSGSYGGAGAAPTPMIM